MRPSLHRSRTTLLLPAAALLLAACNTDAPTAAPTAPRGAVANAGAALLHWAPAVGAPASYAFAIHPDGRVYAAADIDGVRVTERGTLRWTPTGALPGDGAAYDVAITPEGILYAGTAAGVVRSDDGGATWRTTGLVEGYVRHVAVDARGSVYAGVQGIGGGVLRSDDGGLRWTMVQGPFQGRGGLIDWISVRKDDVLLGLYSQVPMYSRDRGETWEYLGALFELPEWNAFANDMLETPGGALLATWVKGIARSDDGGQSFKHVFDGGSVQKLAQDPAGATLYAMLDDGSVLRSTDDGITWTAYAAGFRPRGVEAFAATDAGGLVLGTWQGIWRTVP